MIWKTTGPEGRQVVMGPSVWQHIVDEHPQLRNERGAILDAVAHPDQRHGGREEDEEWFYSSGPGPSRWIKVVVHYEHGRGTIVTAFPRRAFP